MLLDVNTVCQTHACMSYYFLDDRCGYNTSGFVMTSIECSDILAEQPWTCPRCIQATRAYDLEFAETC